MRIAAHVSRKSGPKWGPSSRSLYRQLKPPTEPYDRSEDWPGSRRGRVEPCDVARHRRHVCQDIVDTRVGSYLASPDRLVVLCRVELQVAKR